MRSLWDMILRKKVYPLNKNIAVENSKVSNDYFWKTNKYTDQDVFGRTTGSDGTYQ
ncbi:hypothetical protein OBE_13245 [human gut metagenome]|uniref:Uncharacterized protein n=1 Tax=human gut metagenome TaxID=408170 RepID=K1SEU4_9ZZZZ